MPWDPSKYPANWKEIVEQVRARSGNRCECRCQCGLHTTTGRCVEINGKPAKFAKGIIVLTTAHICKCDPPCGILTHLLHMCQRCHLRTDIDQHMANAKKTREAKKWVNQEALPL
jgi:hypothetical protein